MRRLALIALFVGLAIICLGGGWYWWSTGRFMVSTNNAYIHAEITTVSSRLSGHISKILVRDNQLVSTGDLLAEIDPREYRARESEAQARLSRSQALIDNLKARETLQASLIKQARAELNSQTAELEGIDQKLVRLRSLREQNYAAKDKLDELEISRKSALAQIAKAEAQLLAQQEQLQVLKSEGQELSGRINQDQAELELAQINLANTKITAPVDGTIGKRNLHLGQYVQAATPLVSIVPSEIWVEANFKETQLEHFREGMRVTVSPDAFPDLTIESTIHSLSPATGARFSLLPPENATGNFTKVVQRIPVRINLPSNLREDNYLVPGMSVVVKVDTRH
jgi:membrane fusion protein (multidrug efflux system)